VTWHSVARHGVACRGPAPAEVGIWADPQALATWTRGNLDGYWLRLLDGASRLRGRWGLATLTPYGTVWVVTGVSRLHYTLATGELISKEGAGGYALATFPQRWHRVAHESLRIRRADRARPGIMSAVTAQVGESLRLRDGEGRSLYSTPLARRRRCARLRRHGDQRRPPPLRRPGRWPVGRLRRLSFHAAKRTWQPGWATLGWCLWPARAEFALAAGRVRPAAGGWRRRTANAMAAAGMTRAKPTVIPR